MRSIQASSPLGTLANSADGDAWKEAMEEMDWEGIECSFEITAL
jgi:hypothetical protein